MLGKSIRQIMFRQPKGYQYAGVNKGKLKEYIVHASAVKIIVNHFLKWATTGVG